MSRNTAGPHADGRIHVSIECTVDPDFLARGAAEADIERGLAQVREMARVDSRFASLMNRFGVIREYVWDYGMGGIRLATVREDDTLEWHWSPRSERA
jgi:hypothetical protein